MANVATLDRTERKNDGHRGTAPCHEIATVYGGGGVFGIAYNLGVAEAFVDHGVDLGGASAIGTSAGAWAAAHLALGLRFDARFDLFADQIPGDPTHDPNVCSSWPARCSAATPGVRPFASVWFRCHGCSVRCCVAPTIRSPISSPPRRRCPGCSRHNGSTGFATSTVGSDRWRAPIWASGRPG